MVCIRCFMYIIFMMKGGEYLEKDIIILINVSFTATITFTFIMQRLKDYRHKKSVHGSTPFKKDYSVLKATKTSNGFEFYYSNKKSS